MDLGPLSQLTKATNVFLHLQQRLFHSWPPPSDDGAVCKQFFNFSSGKINLTVNIHFGERVIRRGGCHFLFGQWGSLGVIRRYIFIVRFIIVGVLVAFIIINASKKTLGIKETENGARMGAAPPGL